jgi:magnesium transporter
MMGSSADHLNLPVMTVARKDFTKLREDLTVQEALDSIRRQGLGEKIVYFYVVDDDDRLTGVLPTRRLLTSALDRHLAELMITRVIAIPQTATVMDACDLFILHKFLAFPVVDEQRRIVGLVDVNVFTEEVFDVAKREQWDEVFQTIGFRVSQVRDASPLRAFRFRFPWLTATIGSGTLCALLASGYEATLAKSLVLAFFLTLVLGLGESVSIQSMTVTIQALRSMQPTFRWYVRAFRREVFTAIMLGTVCGGLVGLIAWLWRGEALPAAAIGAGILLTIFAACFFGLSIPVILHALRLDLKISAGPITLALTDIFTLIFYFGVAAILL